MPMYRAYNEAHAVELREELGLIVFLQSAAPDPRSSAVLAIRGFALRAVLISGHT